MEREIPKNVRQIGNVSGTPKIYVEDYVDTFFSQLCEKNAGALTGAFLVGEIQTAEGEERVYIYGALQMAEAPVAEREPMFCEETWQKACEESREYFEGGSLVGWFLANRDVSKKFRNRLVKTHRKWFAAENTLLVLKNKERTGETYFTYQFHDLLEMGGYYIYYEKNPSMQKYMIALRKKRGEDRTEEVVDWAAQNFRHLIRSQGAKKRSRQSRQLAYGICIGLVLVIGVVGGLHMNRWQQGIPADKPMKQPPLSESFLDSQGKFSREPGEEKGERIQKARQEDRTVTTPQKEESMPANQGKSEEMSGNQGKSEEMLGNQIYVVEQGDTLAMISRKKYGDVSHVEAICKMNGLQDGNLIYIGQKLVLP